MHPVELNSYQMNLKNGGLTQVRQTLKDIEDNEPEIPVELLAAIVTMLRQRGKEASREMALPIHNLIGKTHSLELYQAADELGYLEANRFLYNKYISGKVNLYVTNRFYHPEIEPLVIDELYQWINLILQRIRENYTDESSPLHMLLEKSEYDARLKSTQFFNSPYYPVKGILEALQDIGSSKAPGSLLVLDYQFRPLLNDYLVMERRRVDCGDERAIPERKPEDWMMPLGSVNVYALRGILDWMLQFARAEPPSL